jgi:hypothetical protein
MPRFLSLDADRLVNLDRVFEVYWERPTQTGPTSQPDRLIFLSEGGIKAAVADPHASSVWNRLLQFVRDDHHGVATMRLSADDLHALRKD